MNKAASFQPTDFGFAPDAARGLRLDRAVRAGLADSLDVVFNALEPPLSHDQARSRALTHTIEATPVIPAVFGVYIDLVLALMDEREPDAQALIDEILALPAVPATQSLRILDLTDAALGDGQAARYARLLVDDLGLTLAPVAAPDRARAHTKLQAGLALLEAGAPDVSAELHALVREIVLVTAAHGPGGATFDGASTFSLWGVVALNADRLGDRLTTAVALAHESGHNLLFGLTLGDRLVENDDDALYPSPLRRDRRPMEGVAHAVYVTARMIHTLRRLIASGVLTPHEVDSARASVERHRAAYADGLASVMAHARFTSAGAKAFDAMRAAMTQVS